MADDGAISEVVVVVEVGTAKGRGTDGDLEMTGRWRRERSLLLGRG